MTKVNGLAGFLIHMGPMRVALWCMALTVAVLIPLPGTELGETGFDVFRGIVIPTLAPIMFMLLMLDVLMSAVQKSDTQDEVVQARYRTIIRVHLVTVTVMVLASLPFFIDLLAG